MIQVKLHRGQKEIALDAHKYRIICAGRQWGKSVLSRMIVLKWASENQGIYWIVSPTYRQGKQNHWRQLLREVPRKWIVKQNEVELSITLQNGSVIELKGAENPDSLRGAKLNGLVVDEIASIRNWDWLWNEVLQATLLVNDAPAIFISTPRGFNHFYNLFNQGQGGHESYKSWRFTSYDNPFITKANIDEKKKELFEDTFAQEYLADFRTATGLAHKVWDRAIHLIDNFDIPDTWSYARGFDYGSAHPTASVRVAVDSEDNWFVDSCYKQSGRSISEHATTILSEDYGKGFVICYGDPSGAQWFTEFQQNNLNIQPANKEIGQAARSWVEYGVERINERLKPVPGRTVRLPDGRVINNAPCLFVLKRPATNVFVGEVELLKWKETSTGETLPSLDETDDPTGHFDLMAALRYLTVSFKKPADLPEDFNRETKDFSFGTNPNWSINHNGDWSVGTRESNQRLKGR